MATGLILMKYYLNNHTRHASHLKMSHVSKNKVVVIVTPLINKEKTELQGRRASESKVMYC